MKEKPFKPSLFIKSDFFISIIILFSKKKVNTFTLRDYSYPNFTNIIYGQIQEVWFVYGTLNNLENKEDVGVFKNKQAIDELVRRSEKQLKLIKIMHHFERYIDDKTDSVDIMCKGMGEGKFFKLLDYLLSKKEKWHHRCHSDPIQDVNIFISGKISFERYGI